MFLFLLREIPCSKPRRDIFRTLDAALDNLGLRAQDDEEDKEGDDDNAEDEAAFFSRACFIVADGNCCCCCCCCTKLQLAVLDLVLLPLSPDFHRRLFVDVDTSC